MNLDSESDSKLGNRRWSCVGMIGAAICLLGGCMQGGYDTRMEARIQSGGATSPDAQSLIAAGPSDVTDPQDNPTGVTIRLPTIFDGDSTTNRDVPLEMALPGYSYTRVRAVEGGNLYLHMGADSAQGKPISQIQTEILSAVKAVFSTASWTEVNAGGNSWKRISVTADQDFGGTSARGRFVLNLYTSSKFHIILVFRASTEAASASKYFEAMEASLATVQES